MILAYNALALSLGDAPVRAPESGLGECEWTGWRIASLPIDVTDRQDTERETRQTNRQIDRWPTQKYSRDER